MKANINNNPIVQKRIPKRYKRPNGIVVDGYDTLIDLHTADGWRDIITPTYNPATEKLGNLTIVNDTITYYVVSLPVLSPEDLIIQKLEVIKEKYENHKLKGWEAYQDFRGLIVIDIEDEKLTEGQAFLIESFLNVAYNRISSTGDWKTALYELSNVDVTAYPFIVPYYDLAIQNITNYITANY